MALPTYLELVNDVLTRIREPNVATVSENSLSAVIGKFINDSKRYVEDSYSWNTLITTLTVTTEPSVFNYALTDAGARCKVFDAFNRTSKVKMRPYSTAQMNEAFMLSDTPTEGSPAGYNMNGADASGDPLVDFYPVPDGEYTLYFNLYVPQADLSSDTDALRVPKEPVVRMAEAMARAERGEDGSFQSSETYAMAKSVLSDLIAIESSRYPEEDSWGAV